MRRRTFVTLILAASTWPFAVRAQAPAMQVIGHLSVGSPGSGDVMAVLRRHLAEAGYVEGRNVAIDSRWAEGQYDRLPTMAAELVRRQVAVIIATGGSAPAVAARAATTSIPILFSVTDDPVKLGLVASLARPGGNATGVHSFLSDLGSKQLGLLRELAPAAVRLALLVNPNNANAEHLSKETTAAAREMGVEVDVVEASDSREIEAAFAALGRNRADALLVGADPFFYSRRVQLAALATRHAVPAIYNVREYAQAGGLISYGTSLTEIYRQLGVYTVSLLKGANPADLPVVRSTKFELVINMATARVLKLEVPPTLLARADEVIE
jgi:putative ABC transport system substrate-binding protein